MCVYIYLHFCLVGLLLFFFYLPETLNNLKVSALSGKLGYLGCHLSMRNSAQGMNVKVSPGSSKAVIE